MKFGLWFEPEMISPDSDLYREYPDWAIHIDEREGVQSRNQMVLDLSRDEVCEYVINAVSNILANANIEYVKWDMNRHESRRIDNQLRGRSGRQGDPGESRFYISLEDDLMRLFAQERLMNIFNSLGVSEDEQIEHKMLSKAIETAQKKIETNNFGIRSHLLEYDQVMNEQREIMYAERRRVLDGESMRNSIMKMITDYVENVVNRCEWAGSVGYFT